MRRHWIAGRKRLTVLTLWLAIVLLTQAAATALAGEVELEQVQTVAWSADEGYPDGQGVFVFQQTSGCLAARLHVLTPMLDQMTLTYSYSPREGLMFAKLLDEVTGWALEERKRTHLRLPDAGSALDQKKLLASIADVISAGKPAFASLSLQAVGGLSFERRFEEPAGHTPERLAREMELEGFGYRLEQEAPAGLLEKVRRLRAQVCDPQGAGRYCVFGELLATIDQVLTRHSAPASRETSPFTIGKGSVEDSRERLVFEADELGFLHTFSSFDAADPLLGTCAERLAWNENPAALR